MPVTKAEYKQWKQSSPKYAILHKLHSQDVFENFGGLPRPVIMTWADYDKFIHLDDLCAYDLLAVMLGRLSGQVFMFDAPRKWLLAIGDNDVAVEGIVDGDYYCVMLHSPNKQEQLYMKKAMCTEDVGVVDPQRERDINTVDKIHEKLRQKVLTGYMAVLKANGLVKATEKLNEFITKSRRIHPTEFEDDIEWVRMEIAKRCKLHSGAAELSS